MKKHILWIAGAIFAVLLFVGAFFLYRHLSDAYTPAEIPTDSRADQDQTYAAPDFTVEDQAGNEVKLSAYFGKPIVLNFWASWCPLCKAEMPHFEAAYQENLDVQFLMVNMTAGDTLSEAKELIETEGYTFPVLFDTKGNAANTYGAYSLPMTIFIDKDGNLVTYAIGMLSEENLKRGIELIKE